MPSPRRPLSLLQKHSSRSSTPKDDEVGTPQTSSRERADSPHRPPRNHSRHHLVGHRAHPGRVPSVGKNLHRLSKLGNTETEITVKNHKRSKSHDPSTRPLAELVQSHSSKSSLKRTNSDWTQLDPAEDAAPDDSTLSMKKASTRAARSELKAQARAKQDAEDQDAGWTETSASQSPADSRVATKQHSPHQPTFSLQAGVDALRGETDARGVGMQEPLKSVSRGLIPRGHFHTPEPQLTDISVGRTPNTLMDGSTLATSRTLTPSLDSVSKFIGSKGASTLSSRGVSTEALSEGRENASLSLSRPSHSTLSHAAEPPSADSRNLNGLSRNYAQPQIPSRTQQKLWLQRAKSIIEPQQIPINHIMVALRPTGSSLSGHGIGGLGTGYGDGRDPRLHKEIERSAREYMITCRYKKSSPSLQRVSTPSRLSRTFTRTEPVRSHGRDGRKDRPAVEVRKISTLEELSPEDPASSFDPSTDGSPIGVERIMQRFWDRVEIRGTD